MTRANLNFVWQERGQNPRTLFHYHNGDQYPEGLLQFFGIEEFLLIPRLWTPEDFRAWIRKNYKEPCRKIMKLPNGMILNAHAETDEPAEPGDLGEGGQPRISYTDGFTTDYSYVFTHHSSPKRRRKDGTKQFESVNWVSVWSFKRLIFDGNAARFLRFAEKRVKPRVLPGDVAAFSSFASALGNLAGDGN